MSHWEPLIGVSRNSPVPKSSKPQSSIRLCHVHARVVVLDDRVGFDAHFGEAVGAVLAHPHAVAPTATRESVARDRVSRIAFIDDEKLFAETQRRPDLAAFEDFHSVGTDDLEFHSSPRIPFSFDIHVKERADAANVSDSLDSTAEAESDLVQLVNGDIFSATVGASVGSISRYQTAPLPSVW